eukprot:s183_g19.t1
MAPPLTIPAGSPRSWNPNAIKDFGPHSLDERTRNALEAFENAVRPAGLAAGGSDGEKVRARSTKLLDKECRGLVNAGEQLVAAVAKLGECPMLVMLLQKLPRLLARQAVMIALSDVMPELLDRECLKTQVDEMQKKQLSSTTQYLKELGAVRSRLRHVSAAPGAAPTAPGTIARPATVDEPDVEPGGGDTPQQSPSMASVTSVSSRRGSANGGLERSETRRMSSSLRPAKQGGPQPSLSRRTSFADGAEQVNIEVTGPDDVVGSNETLEPKSSPSLQSMTSRKARRSISVTAAANAAMAFKRSQVMAATTNDLEVGPEFGDVHHYMWDAVEHLDKGLQVIVCKVIAEKLQCFKTQKEQTSVAELRALCKRLESYLKGTAAEEHERQLQEVLAEMEEKHGEIRRLTETIQVNAETAEEAKKKLLKTMDEKDKLRDTIQRELVETQAKLESSQLKLQELTQQVSKLKEAEALRQKERAALQKERKKVVHFSHKAEGGTANIKDFFQHFLPKMVLHLSKELRDPAMQEHLLQTLDLLQRDYAEAEKKHQSVISRAKSAEQEVADLSAKARKLEQWKVTLEEQNAVLQERIAEVENNMVQLQSGFLDAIHKAPAYMSLREEYEILKCECEGIAVRTQMLQAEIYRRDEDKAQLQGQIEERDARIARLEDEVRDVAASQLHPTQVAQLRADLKRTKHECEALSNANEVLRNTLATISEKELRAAKGLKHQQRLVVGPMVFTSDFDSGNMGHVELTAAEGILEYTIDVAPDCCGRVHETGYKSWFFFGLSVAEPVELAEHVERNETGETSTPDGCEVKGDGNHEDPLEATAPSEDDGKDEISESLSDSAADKASEGDQAEPRQYASDVPDPPDLPAIQGEVSMYLTVRNMNNHTKLYSDGYRPWCKRPGDAWRRLADRSSLEFSIVREAETFGIRWRHEASRGAGTTYFAFCAPYGYLDCQGLLEELDEAFADHTYSWPDPHRPACSLRQQFQFKLVPMLNPDGVACGHYRTNTIGLNLNRHYDKPNVLSHEGVWAVKRCLSLWSKQGRLLFYLDLHGHASKKGCFLFANRMAGPGQGWNSGYARVFQVNSPHFDLEQCEFGDDYEKEFREGIGKHGSGRVAIHRDCRLCNSYTLECNYNKGRLSRPIVQPKGLTGVDPPAAQEPVPYDQGTWAQIGEASCISILDLFGHNCHSRLPNSVRHTSLQSLLGSTIRPRTGRTTHVKDVVPQGVGLSPEDVAARERPCWRVGCCWADGRTRPGRPPSRERAGMVRAPLAEPREARVAESETLEKRLEDGRPKELRIAGARAVPRPKNGEGKAASEPSRTLDRMLKAPPIEERCPSEAKHKPCRLERLPSAKAKDPKDPWKICWMQLDPVSCRESKENKEPKVRQAQVLRRRRTLLEKPEGEDPMRDVSLIKDMCSRSVHNRLYEDAVRRQDRNSDSPERPLEHAESWAAGHTDKRPHSASAVPRKPSPGSSPTNLAIGRSRSEPSSRILQQMLQTNAQSLRGMLDEPLFHHNLRLPVSPGRPPELANLPGMQVSPSTTLHSPSVTPRCHDFAQLSEIVSEIVPRSHLAGKSSPRPPSSRSAACSSRSPSRPRCVSRFGAESPGFSPRTQREGTPTESARPSRQPSDATPRDTKRGNFAEAVAELRAETGWRSRPQSAEDSKPGERPATHTGVLRDIFDPKEKEEEPHVHRRAMPVAVKPRSCTNSPQQLPERATPRITYPRPHPRVAASLLPTVRPKSARPPPLVPFMSTSPMRPQSCDP